MVACANIVSGKHILDALTLISSVTKKGAKIVKLLLQSCRDNGIKKGYAEERFYVKSIIVGRRLGHKKIDIRGRGKMGMIHPSISSLKVVMEEKPLSEFYKLVVSGKCPPTVGNVFKKILY
jgi:ribosomal protein L22